MLAPGLSLLLLFAAPELLGPQVRQDGYTLRPPQAFRMARMDLFHGSRVGAVGDRDDPARRLSAVLVDSDGEDAASLMVSVVERGFKPGVSARDELSAAVARHFADELGLKFVLERVAVVTTGSGRVEVRGSVRDGSQLRQVLVAAFAGEARHVVVLFSVPSGRWDSLSEAVRESLDSVRPDPVAVAAAPRAVALAVAALVASALLASIGLWRRRRSLTRRP